MGLLRRSRPAEPAGRRRVVGQDGSQSPRPAQAFSYYSKRAESQDGTGRRDPARTDSGPAGGARQLTAGLRRHRLAGIGVAIIGFAALCYLLPLSTTPRIVPLQDTTTAYFLQDSSIYQQTAAETLGRSLFNRNKLTVDTARVRLELLKQYPELRSVSVALPLLGHQPQVYIEPYRPSFILTTNAGNAFLLDATGRALANASQITDSVRTAVPTLQDHSGVAVRLGSRALPGTTVSFTETVLAALKHGQVTPSTVSLPAGGSELDVTIAETPYYVKFNLQNDALEQAGTFLAVRQRLIADHVQPAQYIDVRVPGRAYYK